jgi:hypothetical protein
VSGVFAQAPIHAAIARELIAERQRQISAEGYSIFHDDTEHGLGDLALAAGFLAIVGYPGAGEAQVKLEGELAMRGWLLKLKGRRRNLIRAGALLLAEIARLDRQEQALAISAAEPRHRAAKAPRGKPSSTSSRSNDGDLPA